MPECSRRYERHGFFLRGSRCIGFFRYSISVFSGPDGVKSLGLLDFVTFRYLQSVISHVRLSAGNERMHTMLIVAHILLGLAVAMTCAAGVVAFKIVKGSKNG